MNNKQFQEAKKLDDKIDELTTYLSKLQLAKGCCQIKEVKITYHAGMYSTKCEVSLKDEALDSVKEMLVKEIDRTKLERDDLQKEFDNL